MHVVLAAFIYLAAQSEEMQVLHEERRRRQAVESDGVWVAPPGFRWVHRGNGVWQLAPIVVPAANPYAGQATYMGPSSWT
jgi:hypothetical protein